MTHLLFLNEFTFILIVIGAVMRFLCSFIIRIAWLQKLSNVMLAWALQCFAMNRYLPYTISIPLIIASFLYFYSYAYELIAIPMAYFQRQRSGNLPVQIGPQEALDALRRVICSDTHDIRFRQGYVLPQEPPIKLSRQEAEAAIRHGIPIGIVDTRPCEGDSPFGAVVRFHDDAILQYIQDPDYHNNACIFPSSHTARLYQYLRKAMELESMMQTKIQ